MYKKRIYMFHSNETVIPDKNTEHFQADKQFPSLYLFLHHSKLIENYDVQRWTH